MTVSNTARRALLSSAAVCVAAAGGMFLQYAQRSPADFYPPAEDICVVTPSQTSSAHAWDSASGLGKYDARPIPTDARCPVCGMYPARYPTWAAQLIFKDGTAHFFDSAVDLFMFLDEPARFDQAHTADDVEALYVADHLRASWLAARAAFFVIGAKVHGPMRGPDIPAFASIDEATAFVSEHGGRVLRFDAIDSSTVATLRDANHATHTH